MLRQYRDALFSAETGSAFLRVMTSAFPKTVFSIVNSGP